MSNGKRIAGWAARTAESTSAIFRLVAHAVLSSWWPSLTIVRDSPSLFELDANGFSIVADRQEEVVSLNSNRLASFGIINAVQIQHFSSGAGNRRRDWWTLSLQFPNRRTAYLGKTRDSVEASIAAARLSTMTGKPVVYLAQTGLRATGNEP